MSTAHHRKHRPRVRYDPQPPRAHHATQQPEGEPPPTPRWREWRVVLLLAMAGVLFTGAWKAHPLFSLLLPTVATVVWLPAFRHRRVERWLFIYTLGIYVYTVLRAYADEAGFPVRVEYAIRFDRLLFGGSVPSVLLQRELFSPGDIDWLDTAATLVHASFFVVPHLALLLIWLKRPGALPAYVASVLCTLYLGLALFFFFPTMPPWLAARHAEIASTYRVVDFVLRGVDPQTYRTFYASLAEPNSVAAMPSIHMALTTLLWLRTRELAPKLSWPLALYSIVMGVSLVYLGEHYVTDVLAGALLAALTDYVVRRYFARHALAQPAPVRV
jgi:membrane-associated phospholipid phosphatase